MRSANDLAFSVAMVDLDFALDQMLFLLRFPDQEKDLLWAHEVCAYSRLIHLNVWSDRPPVEFVRGRVLNEVMKKAEQSVTEQMRKGLFSGEDGETVRHFHENLILRIRNLEENYLCGKPSDFDPEERNPSARENLYAP